MVKRPAETRTTLAMLKDDWTVTTPAVTEKMTDALTDALGQPVAVVVVAQEVQP